MLDISAQPAVAAASPSPVAAAKPSVSIPSVSGSMGRLVEVTALAVVLVVALVGGYLSFAKAQLDSQVAAQTRAVEELTQSLAVPERVKAATIADQLSQGVDALGDLAAAKPTWTPLLAELAKRSPGAVTFTNISVDDTQTVRVNGSGRTFLDVAVVLSNFSASPELKDVTLESSSLSESNEGSSVTFALRATYVPSQTPAEEKTTSEETP